MLISLVLKQIRHLLLFVEMATYAMAQNDTQTIAVDFDRNLIATRLY